MVHVSEISREKIKTPVGMFTVGDMLKTVVINVSAADRKIGLSLKALEEDTAEKGEESTAGGAEETAQKQQAATKAASGPSTFGDLLKAAANAEGEESSEK